MVSLEPTLQLVRVLRARSIDVGDEHLEVFDMRVDQMAECTADLGGGF